MPTFITINQKSADAYEGPTVESIPKADIIILTQTWLRVPDSAHMADFSVKETKGEVVA